MDCCNYMQHRPPYYAALYYEGGAPYGHEYQQHQYNVGAQPYAAHNWPFTASCSDYVYNPKEARIRKAIRDRERTMGAGQMGTQRARRPPHWPKSIAHTSQTNTIMGCQATKDLRNAIRAEIENGFLANNGGYMYSPENYPFSPHIDYLNFMHPNSPDSWSQNSYSQGNIPPQEMWHDYQEERLRMRHHQGGPYVLGSSNQAPGYQNVEPIPVNMSMVQGPKQSILQNLGSSHGDQNRYLSMSASSSNSQNSQMELPSSGAESIATVEPSSCSELSKTNTGASSITESLSNSAHVSEDTGNASTNTTGAGISDIVTISSGSKTAEEINMESVLRLGNVADKTDHSFGGIDLFDDDNLPSMTSTNIPKPLNPQHMSPTVAERQNANSLPDFNQAFGSTERGRFQSPPDPRIGPEKEYINYFNANLLVKAEQYNKWIEIADNFSSTSCNISF